MAEQLQDPRSIPQLISDLTSDLATLVRQELQLLRAEVSEKTSQIGKGAGKAGGGVVLLLAAVLFVLQSLVIALANLTGLGWASLIIGVIAAIVGYLLLKSGINDAKPQNLKPERSAHQLREDVQLAKDQVK